MFDAKRDNNQVTTLIGVSSVDGITPVTVYVDPVTHRVLVQSAGGASIAIGSTVTSGTNGSILFVAAGALAQDNNNFYIQDSNTGLATNTVVAVSFGTSGDFSSTDTLNIYAQMDAYLPNSAITNSVTGIATDGATPGYTASSSRGTGPVPVQLQSGDLAGGFSAWGAQGASSPTYANLGGMFGFASGVSTNNLGGELRWYTKADGGALAQRMIMTNQGWIGLGNVDNTTINALYTVEVDAIGATVPTTAQGLLLQNITAAANGAQQFTPALSFSSNGWGTTGGTSQTIIWKNYATTTQSTVPTGTIIWAESVAGAGFTTRMSLTTAGLLTITGSITASGGTSIITANRTAIAVTSSDGFVASNTTASTVGTPVQMSSRSRWSGTAWNTTAVASQTVDFIAETLPSSGATISAAWNLSAQINGGGYTQVFSVSSAGAVTALSFNGVALTTGGSGSNFLNDQGNYVAVSGGTTWNVVTTTSQAIAVNNGYISNNASLVTMTLPATAAVGTIVEVTGLGAGGWKIAQNALQSINFGSKTTTVGTGGSLASFNQFDSIKLVCVVANTTWNVLSSQGNITIV